MYIVKRKRKNEENFLRVFKATPNKNSIPFHNIFKKERENFWRIYRLCLYCSRLCEGESARRTFLCKRGREGKCSSSFFASKVLFAPDCEIYVFLRQKAIHMPKLQELWLQLFSRKAKDFWHMISELPYREREELLQHPYSLATSKQQQ